MTLLVGILHKEGIILASESRTSSLAGSTDRRDDTKKIEIVHFKNCQLLVARAGHEPTGCGILEEFRCLAKDQELTDYRGVSSRMSEATGSYKRKMRQGLGCGSMDEVKQTIQTSDFTSEFLIAFYFGEKPHLYKMSLIPGVPNPVSHRWETVGCAANLGNFILTRHFDPDLPFEMLIALAIYAVEIAKEHDNACGGPVQVGIASQIFCEETATNLSFARILEKEDVREIGALINEVHAKHMKEWNKKLLAGLWQHTTNKINGLIRNPA